MSPYVHSPARPSSLRHVVALALRSASASAGLDRMAHRLAVAEAAAPRIDARSPQVEFHAEAGALEGALYVDGQLVAMLPGVKRL
jgi:hypothetical protein